MKSIKNKIQVFLTSSLLMLNGKTCISEDLLTDLKKQPDLIQKTKSTKTVSDGYNIHKIHKIRHALKKVEIFLHKAQEALNTEEETSNTVSFMKMK